MKNTIFAKIHSKYMGNVIRSISHVKGKASRIMYLRDPMHPLNLKSTVFPVSEAAPDRTAFFCRGALSGQNVKNVKYVLRFTQCQTPQASQLSNYNGPT